jgi:formate hydrogenlyase subunit 6/NADH:ubiquinone oxidoreductase subunit I
LRLPGEVPEKDRGKPEFDLETCIGCGACVNVCPTPGCLSMEDDLQASPPVRKITLRCDICISCGKCESACTTESGIALFNDCDLAVLNREDAIETNEFELQLCEKCGELIGTKKHLVWLYEKLGALAYTNPSLLIAKSRELLREPPEVGRQQSGKNFQTSDFMRILCPKCKCELNTRL